MQSIDVSIVSHGSGAMAAEALKALALSFASQECGLRVWLTINIPDSSLIKSIQQTQWPFDLHIIKNSIPLGFGANHNQAFAHAQILGGGKWFCVMNPDVLWPRESDAFWAALQSDVFELEVGLVGPMQVDEHGALQDSIRDLPTPWSVAARMVQRLTGSISIFKSLPPSSADWINGACMVWRSNVFGDLGGFDERYFMYCEDTDICLRMRLAGYRIEHGSSKVIHLAQRNTSKSWRHFFWHVRSLLRLWLSMAFWRYVLQFKVAPP